MQRDETMKTYAHPNMNEVANKLEDKSIDLTAVWATGFNNQWRHYIITDDAEYILISNHDYDILVGYEEELRVAYKALGLLLAPAKTAKRRAEIHAKLDAAQPVITEADTVRIQAEWDQINAALAEIILRRS